MDEAASLLHAAEMASWKHRLADIEDQLKQQKDDNEELVKQTKRLSEQGKKDQEELDRLMKLMSENEVQSKRELAAAVANVKKAVEDSASQAARDAEIIVQLKATIDERQLQMKKDQEERQQLQRQTIEGGSYQHILSTHSVNVTY